MYSHRKVYVMVLERIQEERHSFGPGLGKVDQCSTLAKFAPLVCALLIWRRLTTMSLWKSCGGHRENMG